MGFEAMRLDETPPSKYRRSREPELSLELLPSKKSEQRRSQQRQLGKRTSEGGEPGANGAPEMSEENV